MRKTTSEFKEAVKSAWLVWAGQGLPEEALVSILVADAVAILEISDEHPEWFINEDPPSMHNGHRPTRRKVDDG